MNEIEKAGFAFGISLVITWILGPLIIPLLYRLRFGQEIRSDGPRSHLQKRGTATMGGLLILVGTGLSSLLVTGNSEIFLLLGVMYGCGLLGFIDDFLKVVLKRPLGLRARIKILGQLVIGVILALGSRLLGRGTVLALPVIGFSLDLGVFYYLFVVFVLVAATNAVNLTDGLDGLAGGLMVIVGLTYIFIGWMMEQDPTAVFAAALAGGCLGFLRFNYHPARIFMGDTGSLGLGGALAGLAVLTRSELVLPILGGVFVIEALSVIIQVISFRLTGRRIFRMSPLHHHFELKGWSELKVVYFFWFLGLCLAILGFLAVRR